MVVSSNRRLHTLVLSRLSNRLLHQRICTTLLTGYDSPTELIDPSGAVTSDEVDELLAKIKAYLLSSKVGGIACVARRHLAQAHRTRPRAKTCLPTQRSTRYFCCWMGIRTWTRS